MSTTTEPIGAQAAPRRFPEEPSPLRKRSKDFGMRLAGRIGVGLNGMLGSRAGGALGILMYHRVADHVVALPAPLYNVTPHRFREQLTGLRERGFRFWPLSRALAHHASGAPIPRRTVLVTFDDGFGTVSTNAYPVLWDLAIPATVFVSTAYLDTDAPFPFDAWGVAHGSRAPAESYRPLTTKQCCDMLASGRVDIGAHTHTHEDHRGRPDAFRDDVQMSVDRVRTAFGVERVPFAFPVGSRYRGFVDDDLEEAARKTGVTCGLTTEPVLVEAASDPFRWGRFNVFPWDTSVTLAAKLSGWYSWAPKLNKRCGGVASSFRNARWFSCALKKAAPRQYSPISRERH